MMSAETVADVTRILAERGRTQANGEDFSAFVARGFELPRKVARAFLGALQDGNLLEDAMLIAGIDSAIPRIRPTTRVPLLIRIARVIGAGLGTAVARYSVLVNRTA